MINRERLLERFLRYVRIDTTAIEGATSYPSSPGQLELGALLVQELHAAGIHNAAQDAHGIVTAFISARQSTTPIVAFNAHLDTSPETTGANVQPQVVANYGGGDLVLPANPQRVIRVADNPELESLRGCTLITTDGTTLLGGDDKAGVAVIMELAEHLLEDGRQAHCPVRLLFTCDEEIGRGVEHVDVPGLGATVCYTLDGPGAGQIDVETFSANLALVTVRGVNIHPAIANGRMVNAIRAASRFIDLLPRELSPEMTADRAGFLHPYQIEGGVAEVTLRIILRDFETAALEKQAELLRQAAAQTEGAVPGCSVAVAIRPQYRNLREGLQREPRAVSYAQAAHRRLGREANLTIIRGGTDGSQFTARGLPTPNLSTGQHNLHSPLEWVCLEEMVQAVEVLAELVQIWGEDHAGELSSNPGAARA